MSNTITKTTPIISSHPHSSCGAASTLLQELRSAEKERFQLSKQVLTYKEFIEEVMDNPKKYLRDSDQYTLDCIDYWNETTNVEEDAKVRVLGHEVRPFAFASKPWLPEELTEKMQVRGQELVLNDIYDILKTFSRKKHPDRMIMLHGKTATGKSVILDTLFEALEHYSQTDEGALYTFNWVFDNDDEYSSSFESLFPLYSGDNAVPHTESTDEALVTMPNRFRPDPIFLLDVNRRIKLLNALSKEEKLPPDFNMDTIISGSLDSSSQKIYEALWKLYDGDINKILKHVQVVRYTLSKQNNRGLVTISPGKANEYANLTQTTLETDWGKLPPKIKEAFNAAGLHEVAGPIAQANRGHLRFEDIFKPDTRSGAMGEYSFLHRIAEKAETTISEVYGTNAVDETVDTIIWGTTNDQNLEQLQSRYPDWKSLVERFTFVTVSNERRYKTIADIHSDFVKQLISPNNSRHVSPHALETFALWETMTYMFPPANEKYYDSVDIDPSKPLKKVVMKMNGSQSAPLFKALLYQEEDINSFEVDPRQQKFNKEEENLLTRYTKEIADEYNFGVGKHKFDSFYEGGSGLSIRHGENILKGAILLKPNECFSELEIFDTLEEWIKHGLEEFEGERRHYIASFKEAIAQAQAAKKDSNLSIPLPEFPSSLKLLELAKEHSQRQIRYEVNHALGVIKTDEEYTHNLRKYLEHVIAHLAKESVTKQWREPTNSNKPNEEFIKDMEKVLNPYSGTPQETFRNNLLLELSQWKSKHNDENSMEHPEIVFPDLLSKLKAKDIEENAEKLKYFLEDLKNYYTRKGEGRETTTSSSTTKEKERIECLEKGLAWLKGIGYCDECIPKLINFAFERK